MEIWTRDTKFTSKQTTRLVSRIASEDFSKTAFSLVTISIPAASAIREWFISDNAVVNDKIFRHVDATKSTKATILPEVIIIQLKRFRHTHYGCHKVNKVVEFPVEAMDFGSYTVNGEPAVYDLVGFIVHEGSTVECGHYFTFIRHEQDRVWYRFDDLNIQKCDPNRVAKEQPYILMFRKRAHKDISIFETLKERVVHTDVVSGGNKVFHLSRFYSIRTIDSLRDVQQFGKLYKKRWRMISSTTRRPLNFSRQSLNERSK